LKDMKQSRTVILLLISLIIIILCTGCAKKLTSNVVRANQDDYSSYSKIIGKILPTYKIEESDNKVYYALENGNVAEAFDTQAVGAIETGIAKYWYPQYLATVIIALDRDQTDVGLTGWNDLYATQEEVSFSNTTGNVQMLTAAMSFGLEGENYTLSKAVDLLSKLHKNNILKINSFESPIIICYDYQAAELIKNGRNIEIVIPKEGTFTYKKGLLSNKKLDFKGNVNELLLESNFRLLDGESKHSIYPDESEYKKTSNVIDYNHFAKETQKAICFFERKVLKTKTLMSIDNREHLNFALVYIIVVTIWAISVLRRSIQKGIGYAAIFTGTTLNGWTLVRLIKYQIEDNPILTRYLWYAFYIFQLSLPLVLLWMAWAIDKPKEKILPPKWWRVMLVVIIFLVAFVFTNDIHGHVFKLDLSRYDWNINYGYGFGYYLILFVCMMNIIVMFMILIKKSLKNPRKKGFIFPIAFFLLFALYNYKYIMRDPVIYETDITIVTGIFTMLMFETCIQSGLIPVNTKYINLFKRSPLRMQIIDKEGKSILASANAEPFDNISLDKILNSSYPALIRQDDKSLLYVNCIPGGYAVWNEDISQLHHLNNKIKESTQMLREANNILAEEEKIKRSINEENTKTQLMTQLETEIAESVVKLTSMIEQLQHSKDNFKETTRIALLLCYIKRRCNLFFQEKETDIIDADKLINYINELFEITKRSNLQIAIINEINGSFAIRYGTLFYDLFNTIADLALEISCPYIIVQLCHEEENTAIHILPAKRIEKLAIDSKLSAAITAVKGMIDIKDLEDTKGISVYFPKGEAYD